MKLLDETFLTDFYGENPCQTECEPKTKEDFFRDMDDFDLMIEMCQRDLQDAIKKNDKYSISMARRSIAKYKKEKVNYKKKYAELSKR